MKTAICTLFEGNYHFGVAALSNSLIKNGFTGTIYIGYRGKLPMWVVNEKKEKLDNVKTNIEINPIEGVILKFIYLETSNHFTNYKPKFMQDLMMEYSDIDNLFYFDPDIVVDIDFSFFEEWINSGIAVSEDINSPLQEFHPRRVGWRAFFKEHNIDLTFKNSIYVNGGFLGVKRESILFLELWIKTQNIATESIGGLGVSFLDEIKIRMFDVFDQDCLNATIEVYDGRISFVGKEGMGFSNGGSIMYHALGSPKPWNAKIFSRALKGRIPRNVDTAYWKNTNFPILAHSKWEIRKKRMVLNISKFIGRFYKV